jgi:hypothetical protein
MLGKVTINHAARRHVSPTGSRGSCHVSCRDPVSTGRPGPRRFFFTFVELANAEESWARQVWRGASALGAGLLERNEKKRREEKRKDRRQPVSQGVFVCLATVSKRRYDVVFLS